MEYNDYRDLNKPLPVSDGKNKPLRVSDGKSKPLPVSDGKTSFQVSNSNFDANNHI